MLPPFLAIVVFLLFVVPVTPPGYKTVNGATVPCEDGSFRSGWANAGAATSCTSCGTGMFALKTDRLVQYDVDTYMPTNIPVTTSEEDCCE